MRVLVGVRGPRSSVRELSLPRAMVEWECKIRLSGCEKNIWKIK